MLRLSGTSELVPFPFMQRSEFLRKPRSLRSERKAVHRNKGQRPTRSRGSTGMKAPMSEELWANTQRVSILKPRKAFTSTGSFPWRAGLNFQP